MQTACTIMVLTQRRNFELLENGNTGIHDRIIIDNGVIILFPNFSVPGLVLLLRSTIFWNHFANNLVTTYA